MKTTRLTLAVTGMTCSHCVRSVANTLEETPGVIDQTVNFDNHQALVTYDGDATSAQQIAAQFADTPYEVAVIG